MSYVYPGSVIPESGSRRKRHFSRVFPPGSTHSPAGKPTEGGSSIPDGISPYQKQDNSNFFPETENLGKRMDLTGNNRERHGNAPEI
jgi:hypothetical protein